MTGNELAYIEEAVKSGKISGDGIFTKKCHSFFERKYFFQKCLLTTSCTDALEMAALLLDIQPGDEVILPSYTFVSTANAFVLRGAKLIFCNSRTDHPGIDENILESLITTKTKAIVPVHYAGIACDMVKIMNLAKKYNLFVVEDAAQAIDSYYLEEEEKKPLGSYGNLAAFSFHETKNVISGEGGMLVINDSQFNERAEIIREKGTNRSKFFRGEIDKYGWVDIGSSFLPSEIIAAFLYAQLESIDDIQNKRILLWQAYWDELQMAEESGLIARPVIPSYSTNNAHMFYVKCKSFEIREKIIAKLKDFGVMSVFHYLPLHKSEFFKKQSDGRNLDMADLYSDTLLRLPLFYELELDDVKSISKIITSVSCE